MKTKTLRIGVAAAMLLALADVASAQIRIKDIAGVQGARKNQLVGYGLVVGLEGTGDSIASFFTVQSTVSMLQKFGINLNGRVLQIKNVAAVLVTADLPAFAKVGSKMDVTVSAMGDAKSLQGGTLIQAPLQGIDGEVYATAQGPLSIGGFNFAAGGAKGQKNHVNVGRVPGGADVEREVPTSITDGQIMDLALKQADFTTADRIAEAINKKMPETRTKALDSYTVRVSIPNQFKSNLVSFISQIESLTVTPDTVAKIVVNERTGTIVIGGDVRISPCAVSHGSLQIKIENTPIVAIPSPFTTNGQPVVVPQKDVIIQENRAKVTAMTATTTIDQLVKALNALGLTPRELISVLQTMRAAGHISADVEVQ